MKEPVFGVKAGGGLVEMLIPAYAHLEIFKAKSSDRKIDLEAYFEEIERLDGPEAAQRTIDLIKDMAPQLVMSEEEAKQARMQAKEQAEKEAED